MGRRSASDSNGSFRDNAQRILPRMLERFFRHQERVIGHPRALDELHRLRISGKPLRYTMEVFQTGFGKDFQRCLGEVEETLDLIGTIHDLDVAIDIVAAFVEELETYNRTSQGRNDRFAIAPVTRLKNDLRIRRGKLFQQMNSLLMRLQKTDFRKRLLLALDTGR